MYTYIFRLLRTHIAGSVVNSCFLEYTIEGWGSGWKNRGIFKVGFWLSLLVYIPIEDSKELQVAEENNKLEWSN